MCVCVYVPLACFVGRGEERGGGYLRTAIVDVCVLVCTCVCVCVGISVVEDYEGGGEEGGGDVSVCVFAGV